MKPKLKEIFIFFALIVFLIPGILAAYSGLRHKLQKNVASGSKYTSVVFSEVYPFKDEKTATNPPVEKPTIKSKYIAVTGKFTKYVDNYTGRSNVLSPFFLYVYGKTNDLLGKNLIDDNESPVIKLGNGYLSYIYLYSQENPHYDGIVDFKAWLKENDISFLYVLPIDKSDERYAAYPKGFPKSNDEIESEYFRDLDENGIKYINSREVLLRENSDFYSWFYKTDHHWNVNAGFSVASAISRSIQTEFALPADTDVLNKKNFNVVKYDNAFLGSQGKKTTHGYIAPEFFEVFYPNFDTLFKVEIPTMTIDETGAFENTLIDAKALKTGDYYKSNTYGSFLYGDVPLIRIHNLKCQNGTRALMLKTSDANVVDTYLALSVEYLDIIDPRNFDGSITTFIEKTNPNVVLICAFPSEIFDRIK